MDLNIGVILTTLFMVLIMEMGDKTQLLVIALTSKYRPSQVFWGIALSILFLNIFAVLLGTAIGGIKIIQDSVRAGASVLFVFFGLLTLKPEDPDEENQDSKKRSGIIITIAIAFFLAEFGDKTQLSTFSFAALYPDNPLSVFLGSTVGLLAADCLGLIAGALVIKYIPKKIITLVSAVLFIIFGLASGWTTMKNHFLLNQQTCVIIIVAATLLSLIAGIAIFRRSKSRWD